MTYIERINQKVGEMKDEGYTGTEAIMELAMEAGLDTFNPYKASEEELKEIADMLQKAETKELPNSYSTQN